MTQKFNIPAEAKHGINILSWIYTIYAVIYTFSEPYESGLSSSFFYNTYPLVFGIIFCIFSYHLLPKDEKRVSKQESIEDIILSELDPVDPQKQTFNSISYLAGVTKRLFDNIKDLNGKANFNLIIGLALAIGGIVTLIIFIADLKKGDTGSNYDIYHFYRLAIVLTTEIIAFFFLRLYRAKLNDIKFYQNEISNIEARTLTVGIAIESNEPEFNKLIIEELLKTDRNFVLEKDQSTRGLQQRKLDQMNDKNLPEKLLKALEAIKKASDKGGS